MEYMIVSEIGSDQFVRVVNQAIYNGWHPLGGVSLAFQQTNNMSVFWYSQAFTR